MCCVSILEGARILLLKKVKSIRDSIHSCLVLSKIIQIHSPLGIILYTVMHCVSILEGARVLLLKEKFIYFTVLRRVHASVSASIQSNIKDH